MTSQIEKVVKVFKAVAQYPSPTSARVMNGVVGSNGITVVSTWSQRNLERGKSVKFQQTHFVDSSLQKSSDMLPMDTTFELLSCFSESEEVRGVVREIPFEPNKKKQYLEVWKNRQLWKNFDLSALEVHGDVYSDGEFGSFDWSPCEQKLLYIAEKKLPKTEPFYKPKAQDNRENGIGDSKAIKGEEHVFRPDWGEQLVGKHQSVVAICDTKSETVSVLEGIPSHFSPGQVSWTPDGKGIVGVVWETEPRRLGLIYCSNRPSYIFHLTVDGEFSMLSSEGHSVRSPRFSTNGENLVWLERPSGGPHNAAHKLMCCKWSSRQVEVIVDVVKQHVPTTDGHAFYGLYGQLLPRRCWALDSSRLLLSSPQNCTVKSYLINIENKTVTELECPEGSQIVLDVRNDVVVCARSSLKSPSCLVVGKLPEKGSEHRITWSAVTNWQSVPSLDNLTYHYMALTQKDDPQASCKSFNAIYFGPESAHNHDVPLIIWPHGGPHSAFTNDFKMESALFGLLGFGMLMVNYRGSVGAGQDSVEFLLGRIGDSDVKDVHLATMEALKQFPFLNPNKMVLFGGSHGGFLVTHLSGQFPNSDTIKKCPESAQWCYYAEWLGTSVRGSWLTFTLDFVDVFVGIDTSKGNNLFKAVVARNPVIDVSAMFTVTDIPDWTAVESGFPYTNTEDMNLTAFEKMKKCSPINYAANVVAPTLLLVGRKDKRVPSSQGIHFYYSLKANNIKTKLYLYDDNHPLSQVPVEMDNLINSVLWFLQHTD